MTITQLRYVITIADTGSFVEASRVCGVTQPALTIQVRNLENELDTVIFDRTKKPVIPTETGFLIIEQARNVLLEAKQVADVVNEQRKLLDGNLKMGIIPTVSPYLLPYFADDFNTSYPNIKLHVQELITEDIVEKLKNGSIDVGIVATPLSANNIITMPVCYEKFYAFVSRNHPLFFKDKVTIEDLNNSDLWLLKEGNCFRDQVINICAEGALKNSENTFKYESHSIEALMQVVELKKGVTLIPELKVKELTGKRKELIREIADNPPMREISVIVRKGYLKKRFIERLKKKIIAGIPEGMSEKPEGILVDPNIKL